MPNGKTIRQIADEIGVTRQAVYQKIKSNQSTISNLKLYTFIVDSVKYYTPDGEALIKSLFSGKSTVKQTVNEGVKLSTESVYTPVNKFTPCKDDETLIKPEVSDGAVNDGVNKAVNMSTEPVYTPVNEFTANLTDLFTAQLKEKDKQIAEKDKQLADLCCSVFTSAVSFGLLLSENADFIRGLSSCKSVSSSVN